MFAVYPSVGRRKVQPGSWSCLLSNIPTFLLFSTSGLTQQSSSKVVTQIYGMVKPKIGNKLVSMFILWYINNKCALSSVICQIHIHPGYIQRDILESLNVTWCEWKLTFRFHPCDGATESASFSSPWSHLKWERAENWDELTLEIWAMSRSYIDPASALIYLHWQLALHWIA